MADLWSACSFQFVLIVRTFWYSLTFTSWYLVVRLFSFFASRFWPCLGDPPAVRESSTNSIPCIHSYRMRGSRANRRLEFCRVYARLFSVLFWESPYLPEIILSPDKRKICRLWSKIKSHTEQYISGIHSYRFRATDLPFRTEKRCDAYVLDSLHWEPWWSQEVS